MTRRTDSSTNRFLSAVIAAGCHALPSEHRADYCREWIAELSTISSQTGRWSALRFTLSLLLTVPKTAVALWTRPNNPFREAIMVVLAVTLPCVFFVGYGIISRQPTLLGGHFGLLVGVFLIGAGMCRDLRHPLHSTSARIGLILAIGSGITLTVVNQLGNVSNPILDGAFRVYPGSSVTMFGFALLLASGLWPTIRQQMIQTGLMMIAGGTFVWAILVLTNTLLATSWVAGTFQVVSAPALLAASYAAWKAFGRPETYRLGDESLTPAEN